VKSSGEMTAAMLAENRAEMAGGGYPASSQQPGSVPGSAK
jgi:hypothetical protein